MITVVPANEAPWEDVEAVLGKARCHGGACFCQRFKSPWGEWGVLSDQQRADRLRAQIEGSPTTGLVAYLDGEPVGWCSVEPRTAFPNLMTSRVVWPGRNEDKTDDSVWAVACLIVRMGYRGQGISGVMAAAAVDFARDRGARALEAYAMITQPGKEITWGELHVGSVGIFTDAGFVEVSRPSKRRVVLRIDF